MDIKMPGPRICIMGPSCSGKSTLANKLGTELNVPVLHLDQITHVPGTNWVRRPDKEVSVEHDRVIAGDRWVIEGNYTFCLPQRLARGTDVIFLDVPVWRCLARYISRSFFEEAEIRTGRLSGAGREFNWPMLWYIVKESPRKRLRYFELFKAYPHLRVQIIR